MIENHFSGESEVVIQAGWIPGGIHIHTPEPAPEIPIAVSVDLIQSFPIIINGKVESVDLKFDVTVQRIGKSEPIISRPHLIVTNEQPARPYLNDHRIRYGARPLDREEIRVIQFKQNIAITTPPPPEGRYEYDMSDGAAANFRIIVAPEVDERNPLEYEYKLKVDWLNEGQRGTIDVWLHHPTKRPFSWHPTIESLCRGTLE